MFPSLSKAIGKKVTSAKDAVGATSSQQQQQKPPQQAAQQQQQQPAAGAHQPPSQQQAWLDTETRQDSTKLCEEALAAIVQAYNQPMISHYKGQQRMRKALPEAIRLSVTLGSLKHEDAAGPLRDATLANAAVGNAIGAKGTFGGIATRVSEAKARLQAAAGELKAVRRAEEDDRELAQAVRRVADAPAAPAAGTAEIDDAPCESVDASPLKSDVSGNPSSSSSSASARGDVPEVGGTSADPTDDGDISEAAAVHAGGEPDEEAAAAAAEEEAAEPAEEARAAADAAAAAAVDVEEVTEDATPVAAAAETPSNPSGKSKKKNKKR